MIYLGADHGGYDLKEKAKVWLTQLGFVFEDLGAHTLDAEDDYPQFAFAVAEKVAADVDKSFGILFCRSSAGVIIAANKVKGVRAVAAMSIEAAKHAREHNDANVLGISGDWTNPDDAEKIIKMFLSTEKSQEARHVRRVQQIQAYEEKYCQNEAETEGCCGGGECACEK